jgi:hypothetical protein
MFLCNILISCASPGAKEYSFNSLVSDQEKFFRHELIVEINDVEYKGTGIIPPKDIYKIKINKAKGRLDLVRISTCAGEEIVEDVGNKGSFTVGLSKEIEGVDSCLFRIAAYEKKKGRHSWFIADFSDPNETLEYNMLCNGWKKTINGVGICESINWQTISFNQEVKIFGEGGQSIECNSWLDKSVGAHWEFRMPLRECIYTFTTVKPPFMGGRLTTSGYDTVLIEGK